MKRMVLSQWSLADTGMCALSSVLVDMNWIAARMPHQLARLARHRTSTSACSSSTAKVQCSSHSCSELEQGGDHTAASAIKALPTTGSEVSATLKLSHLSTLGRRHSSLI